MRNKSFGEGHRLSCVDRFGVWLSQLQIRRWIRGPEGKAIADLGCGYRAMLARSFVDQAAKVYLTDVKLSEESKALPRVTALEGTLPGILHSIPDSELDVVLCISVLEHMEEPDELLRQIVRLLKPGGTALLNVPSWRGKAFLEFSAFRLGLSPAAEMDDHRTYYDVRDLWPRLVAAGFKPSRIRCFSHKFGLNTFAVCQKDT